MKRLAILCCLLSSPSLTSAIENGQVLYVGGTANTIKDGTVGRLDTASESALTFVAGGDRLLIPYAKVESYEYSQDVARHLGVLPAIGAGLIRKRQRKHFFRIAYRDTADVVQVVVFEVPKHMPRSLLAVLQTRAPGGCRQSNTGCIRAN